MSAVASACWVAAPASALTVGEAAPDFSVNDVNGAAVKLSGFKGKIVVLEWNNPECPFVKKFYGANAMQQLQSDAKAKGVVWISLNSAAEGKQGRLTTETAKTYLSEQKAQPAHYVLDPEGKIGKAYDAKTTPHMFIVDKEGKLVYMGAIDDKPSTEAGDIAGAKNYVRAALASLEAGKPIEATSTQAYGCSVKY